MEAARASADGPPEEGEERPERRMQLWWKIARASVRAPTPRSIPPNDLIVLSMPPVMLMRCTPNRFRIRWTCMMSSS